MRTRRMIARNSILFRRSSLAVSIKLSKSSSSETRVLLSSELKSMPKDLVSFGDNLRAIFFLIAYMKS